MEARAPAVVAVVVTTGPSPTLHATLASLAAQDYARLSVLVLANGAPEGLDDAVRATVPAAFVRVLERNEGFAAACNEVPGMVEGAAFYCFCHDDVDLAEDAVHQMVEEAYRSNAGIVTPKFVRPEDRSVLLHVGLNADRFGATTERIEPGEVDQGQHDSARDVFVAPGGVTLIRSDLFATLGGFDDSIVVLGEDLDLCWRAQVAGSRVVVAHDAVVAHHELLANRARTLTAEVSGHGGRTLQALTRRHRLSTMLTCYGWLYLVPTTAVLMVLEAAEVVVAALGRDRERIGAVVGSWRWCLGRLFVLRRRRAQLAKVRALDDHDVRRLQVAGASRLQTFGSKLVHQGVDVARGALGTAAVTATDGEDEERLDRTVGFGAAFSEDQSFDELDDLGHRERPFRIGFLATFAWQVFGGVVVAVVFVVAVRDLFGSTLPLVGRLAPLDSWGSTWQHFFATWSPTGVGTGAPGAPGFGTLAAFGTLVFGRMNVLPRATLILAIPIGVIGVWRLLRGVGSNRARLVAGVSYAFLALGPNLVAAGRTDVLAALAVVPFLVRRLLVVAGVHPFAAREASGEGLLAHPLRAGRARGLVSLGALLALVVAVDPATGVAFLVAAIGVVLGGAAVGDRRAGRPFGVAISASIVALVLLAPLTLDTLAAGVHGVDVFGSPSGPWSLPGLGGLVRLAIGPYGATPLAWLLPAAALLALLVGRSDRLTAAARFTGMGVASLAAALLVARHLLGSFTPDVSTLLVPYAVAVAALIGCGVAAFESDVARAQFGWRQVAAIAAMVAVAVGALPFAAASSSGRFDLPEQGYDVQLGSLPVPLTGGARTLWLGDPRSVPLASWPIEPGLAYATSNELPTGTDAFVPPSSGAASTLSDDVVAALRGETVHLGRLLSVAGVAYVVVVTATAPTLAGSQQPIATPPPAALLPSLHRQLDLAAVPGSGGAQVFFDTAWRGVVAERTAPLSPKATAGEPAAALGWTPALSSAGWSGPVSGGTVVAGLAPADDFVLHVGSTAAPRSSAFGWAASWRVAKGNSQLSLDALPLNGVLASVTLALWLIAVALAIGPERLARIRSAWRRRRADGDAEPSPDVPTDPRPRPAHAPSSAPEATEVVT